MLRAVAIYEAPVDKKNSKPKRLRFAQQESPLSVFPIDQLKDFENHTFHILPPSLEQDRTYTNEVSNEYHYVRQHPGDDFFMVICSKSRLDPTEKCFLFLNLRHAYLRPELVKMDDIITNPLGYTGKDRFIRQIQTDVEELRQIMLKNVDVVLDHREKLETLLLKTEQLQQESVRFNRQAHQVNRRCCFN